MLKLKKLNFGKLLRVKLFHHLMRFADLVVTFTCVKLWREEKRKDILETRMNIVWFLMRQVWGTKSNLKSHHITQSALCNVALSVLFAVFLLHVFQC